MNQFKLTFSLEKPFLPKNLEPFMISFLKEATLNYSEQFHMSLYDKSKSVMKGYTSSKCKVSKRTDLTRDALF